MISLDAFWDELNQIVKVALKLPTKVPAYVTYPATAIAGIMGWEKLKNLKRQRDLGAMMERQMVQEEQPGA